MGGATSSVRTNITLAQHTSTVDTTVISQYKFKNDDTPSHFKTKHLKVVIVGAPRVGKSSIVRRWLHNTFDADLSSYIPTTKVDISLKLITFNDSTLRVEVWDTPSHPEIRDIMLDQYYKDADIVLAVGDVTKPASFRDLQNSIIPKLKKYCNRHYKGRLPILIFLANKNDTQYDSPDLSNAIKDPVSVSEELCNVMGEGMGANVSVLVSARRDWGLDETLEGALQVACTVAPRVWEPLSEMTLLREQQEEEEALRLQQEKEAEAARIAAEEEREIRQMEKEMLRAEGFEVSDDEEEKGEEGYSADDDANRASMSIRVMSPTATAPRPSFGTPDAMNSSFGDISNIDKVMLPVPQMGSLAEEGESTDMEDRSSQNIEKKVGKVQFNVADDDKKTEAADAEFDEDEEDEEEEEPRLARPGTTKVAFSAKAASNTPKPVSNAPKAASPVAAAPVEANEFDEDEEGDGEEAEQEQEQEQEEEQEQPEQEKSDNGAGKSYLVAETVQEDEFDAEEEAGDAHASVPRNTLAAGNTVAEDEFDEEGGEAGVDAGEVARDAEEENANTQPFIVNTAAADEFDEEGDADAGAAEAVDAGEDAAGVQANEGEEHADVDVAQKYVSDEGDDNGDVETNVVMQVMGDEFDDDANAEAAGEQTNYVEPQEADKNQPESAPQEVADDEFD